MQIVETSAEGLSRVYNVTFPAADIAARTDAKIAELAPQLNIKGFRKGKVPLVHVKRMYGKSIRGDLLNDLVQEGINAASTHNGTRAASQADFKNLNNIADALEGTGDLSFDVELDIMPDFVPADLTGVKVTRPVALASEDSVAEALDAIADQSKNFEAKTGPAVDGDAVVCNFLGKLGGEAFEGGKADDATVVLGSGTFIPGFEEQLLGVTAGDTRVLNVTFPADYQVETLAGQAATFDVTVLEVKAPIIPAIDDEFAKTIGFGALEELKGAIRSNIEREYATLSRQKAKRSLLDALDACHSFDLPPKMVAAEFDSIWSQVQKERESGELDPEDVGKSEDELKAEYGKIAERRVRLGLVLAEIGRINGVEVKDSEVIEAVRREAVRLPGQEKEVFDFFNKNPAALAGIRAPVYEEKVVDFILQMADVTDVEVSVEALQNEDEEAPATAPVEKPAAKSTAKKSNKKAAASEEVPEPAPAKASAKAKAKKADPAPEAEVAADPASKKKAAAKRKVPE